MKSSLLWCIIMSTPLVALVFAFILILFILNKSQGNEKMKNIAQAIQKGAMAFLKTEYSILSIFTVIVFFSIFFFIDNSNFFYNT